MRSLLFLTQRFRPRFEATSKEVALLARHFNGKTHDLHLDGYSKIQFHARLFSYHFLYYVLGFFPLYLFSRNKIIHLYTSLCDRPYLPFLNKEKMIVTSANFFRQERIKKKMKSLSRIHTIIIQSEVQKKELREAGMHEQNIKVIYPPVDLQQFSYHKATATTFTILNASCPAKVRYLGKRGIYLLLEADSFLQDTKITFLWRGGEYPLFKERINGKILKNIKIENKIHTDMNFQYAQVHCTIIPYLQLDEYLKTMPTSAIESLAAGKPVLVSSQTGIAEIIKKEKCGVVFEPTPESLLKAVEEIKKNYVVYQKNCRKTAEKYFSQESFLKKHEEIYNSVL
ncbi:MAG: glycosyltransferase family 4 protein [Nanoarchaeota archaeon]|nr:glycosyltransferase family 4 protein [Nanoarchaeota archaeon]